MAAFPLHPHMMKRERALVSSTYKGTDSIMGSPLLRLYLNLILSQRLHQQIPSHWELGHQYMTFDEIHSAHSIWPYSHCSVGTKVRRTGEKTNNCFWCEWKVLCLRPRSHMSSSYIRLCVAVLLVSLQVGFNLRLWAVLKMILNEVVKIIMHLNSIVRIIYTPYI